MGKSRKRQKGGAGLTGGLTGSPDAALWSYFGTATYVDLGHFKKTGSTQAWDSIVGSKGSISGSSSITFAIVSPAVQLAVGYSQTPAAATDTLANLKYAFVFNATGTFSISENGTNLGQFGTYYPNDVFMLMFDGFNMQYMQNGKPVKSSSLQSNEYLYFEAIMFTSTTEINGVSFAGVNYRGPTGPQGLKGDPGGPTGPVGRIGGTGPSGATGPFGPSGATGLRGLPSIVTGPSGPSGATGPIGLPSVVTGPSGPSGPSGRSGPTGPSGATGPTGPIGQIGSPGSAANTGATGVIGPSGPSGATGATGPFLGTFQYTYSNTVTTDPSSGAFLMKSGAGLIWSSNPIPPRVPFSLTFTFSNVTTLGARQAFGLISQAVGTAGQNLVNGIVNTSAQLNIWLNGTTNSTFNKNNGTAGTYAAVATPQTIQILYDGLNIQIFINGIQFGLATKLTTTTPLYVFVDAGGTPNTACINGPIIINYQPLVGATGQTGPAGVPGPAGVSGTIFVNSVYDIAVLPTIKSDNSSQTPGLGNALTSAGSINAINGITYSSILSSTPDKYITFESIGAPAGSFKNVLNVPLFITITVSNIIVPSDILRTNTPFIQLGIRVFSSLNNEVLFKAQPTWSPSLLTSTTNSTNSTFYANFMLPLNAYFIVYLIYNSTAALGPGSTPLTFNLNIVQTSIAAGGSRTPKQNKRKTKSKKKRALIK
jgi:hypothetical protein